MQVGEGGEDVEHVFDGLHHVQAAVGSLLHHRGEGAARHVFHDDVAGAPDGEEVVDGDDVRMLDGRQELPLLDGHGGQERIVVGEDGLDDDGTLEQHVLGQVDDAHAAPPDLPLDSIFPVEHVADPDAGVAVMLGDGCQ